VYWTPVLKNQAAARSYGHNEQENRLQQTVESVATTYLNDLNARLTQVLSDGTNTYLYGNGRLAQDDSENMGYFLGDALGSVRQLTDADGLVTLPQSYEAYGDVLTSDGTGTSIYGFAAEQTDSYIKLINLRSRLYNPSFGRFLTRDSWQGEYNKPQSLNKWLYGNANPIAYVDPTGFYGMEVHYEMTYEQVLYWSRIYPVHNVVGEELANEIASWDERVDYSPYLLPVGACGECHFEPYSTTTFHIKMGIYSHEPYIFGGVMHQLQDYYSHWNEGYHDQILGHGTDSFAAYLRSDDALENFYKGCHMWNNGMYDVCLPSRFPAHPKDEVISNIRVRNPNIDLTNLTDWDLIDLYLRNEFLYPSSPTDLSEERAYFGFRPDMYVPSSFRDSFMKSDSNEYIEKFMQELMLADCVELRNPPDLERERTVREYLTY
jgi:RHS repeat-associated protein